MSETPDTPAANRHNDLSELTSPFAQGTAARADFTKDTKAKSTANILLVQDDLKDKEIVHIVHFLKAILGRMILERKGNVLSDDPLFHQEIFDERNALFGEMLEAAVSFCNDKKSKSWRELVGHMQTYCEQSYEPNRYLPISNALNTILVEFGNKSYGSFPKPMGKGDKKEIIYFPNDPNVLTAEHLWEKTYRKPDVIGVYLSLLCELHEDYGIKGYKSIAKEISREATKSKQRTRDLTWVDVQQTIELKLKNSMLQFEDDRQWSIDEIMNFLELETNTIGRKRRAQDCNTQDNASRRSRKQKTTTQNVHIDIHTEEYFQDDSDQPIDPDVQCAFYGIERLSCQWTMMHTTVILLNDEFLTLCWYDAQGCIESEPFNMLENAPILVLMMMIFQRFNPYMWGVSQSDPSAVKFQGQKYGLDHAPAKFQLKGRRTAIAFAEPEPDRVTRSMKWPPPAADMKFCFKSSWKECIRVHEYIIIAEAFKRVSELLPEEFRTMVTDHLPRVIASQECSTESTAVIRFFVDQAKGDTRTPIGSIRKGSRVRVWIIAERLDALFKLQPCDFWQGFWDIVRCHYLLWRMGIAHCDISLNNMMCTKKYGRVIGILNDYDLAALMEPGARFPEKSGWERTGSAPFMAVDLLSYFDGSMQRWYRHDLESFSWCLLWKMFRKPPHYWTHEAFSKVATKKTECIAKFELYSGELKKEWDFSSKFMVSWILKLRDQCTRISTTVIATLLEEDNLNAPASHKLDICKVEYKKVEDTDQIRVIVEIAKKVDCGLSVPALASTSWIDVALLTPPV